MSLLKFAGKNSKNQATAIACDDNGNLKVRKEGKQDVITLVNNLPLRNEVVNTSDAPIDCSAYDTISLRVIDSLDTSVTIYFLTDDSIAGTSWVKNIKNEWVMVTIPKPTVNPTVFVITPEDVPFLKYCNNLKLRIAASPAASSGTLTIKVIGKH